MGSICVLTIVLLVAIFRSDCSGFIVERSDFNASSTWDVVSFTSEQRLSSDFSLDGKIRNYTQSNVTDKSIEITEARELKRANETTNEPLKAKEPKDLLNLHERKFEVNDTKGSPEEATNTLTPRNVILLLIDDRNQDRENLWSNFETLHLFPVQGYLEDCQDVRTNSSELLSSGTPDRTDHGNHGNKVEECHCESLLRENLDGLLSWARSFKEMRTGTVSATNFSVLSGMSYEGSYGSTQQTGSNSSGSLIPETRRTKRELRNTWHLIDLGRQTNPASSPVVTPHAKQEASSSYDSMWDVLETFSRIRMAFFRSLLESLSLPTSRNNLTTRNFSNVVNLIDETIKDLKYGNERGYLLVAVASGSDLEPVTEFLRHEVPSKTLLIISAVCSSNSKPVPFYAEGPSSEVLLEARTLPKLPITIQEILDCKNFNCKYRSQNDFGFLDAEFFSKDDPPRMRVIRSNETAEKIESSTWNTTERQHDKDKNSTDKSTGDKDDSNGEEDSDDDDNTSGNTTSKATIEKKTVRAAAPEVIADRFAAFAGIATSLLTAIALTSS